MTSCRSFSRRLPPRARPFHRLDRPHSDWPTTPDPPPTIAPRSAEGPRTSPTDDPASLRDRLKFGTVSPSDFAGSTELGGTRSCFEISSSLLVVVEPMWPASDRERVYRSPPRPPRQRRAQESDSGVRVGDLVLARCRRSSRLNDFSYIFVLNASISAVPALALIDPSSSLR
jgi:hypothetical protein